MIAIPWERKYSASESMTKLLSVINLVGRQDLILPLERMS
jgi:hypothetical protein